MAANELIRTETPVRKLGAQALEIDGNEAIKEHGSNRPDDEPLDDNDPRLVEVRGLLERYGGVIFSGPPGTSKSYYANKIGAALADHDDRRIEYVQFHPSYQYEDFMQGFVPKESGGGFEMKPKHFLRLCIDAAADPDKTYVLVVDELSRGDPGRVFGEALTYVEKSKRGLAFSLASGQRCVVPANLVVLATMNPHDRGVDEVDAAFERRFAKIAMEPDAEILESFLEANDVPEHLRPRIVGFFRTVTGHAKQNPLASVGQTFFMDVHDETDLRSLWDHQLRFIFEKAYRLDPESLLATKNRWGQIFAAAPDTKQPSSPLTEAAEADVGEPSSTE